MRIWPIQVNGCNCDFAPTAILPQLKCESRVSERHTVAYLRALLSGVAALLLAILGPPLFVSLQIRRLRSQLDDEWLKVLPIIGTSASRLQKL